MEYLKASDGVKIAVYDYNCQGKETIVLVHGWPLSHKMYEYQIPMLVQCGFRVVLLDLRGFGMSDSTGCNYSYDRMAMDIFQVVRALRLNRFTLCGFSMGGAIALRYMRVCRGFGVKRLILLAAAAPCFTKRKDFPFGLTKEYVNGLLFQIATDRPQFCEDFTGQLFACPHSDAVKCWFDDIALSASARGTLETGVALRDEDGRADLEAVDVPTVIIHGGKDQVVSNDLARIQHECIKGSRLYTLRNSGHGIIYDELEKFNDIFMNALMGVEHKEEKCGGEDESKHEEKCGCQEEKKCEEKSCCEQKCECEAEKKQEEKCGCEAEKRREEKCGCEEDRRHDEICGCEADRRRDVKCGCESDRRCDEKCGCEPDRRREEKNGCVVNHRREEKCGCEADRRREEKCGCEADRRREEKCGCEADRRREEKCGCEAVRREEKCGCEADRRREEKCGCEANRRREERCGCEADRKRDEKCGCEADRRRDEKCGCEADRRRDEKCGSEMHRRPEGHPGCENRQRMEHVNCVDGRKQNEKCGNIENQRNNGTCGCVRNQRHDDTNRCMENQRRAEPGRCVENNRCQDGCGRRSENRMQGNRWGQMQYPRQENQRGRSGNMNCRRTNESANQTQNKSGCNKSELS